MWWPPLFPLLFGVAVVPLLNGGVLSEVVQLVEMVDLDNVTFTKSVRFADNGTLMEDIQRLDELYTVETEHRQMMGKKKRPKMKREDGEEKPKWERKSQTAGGRRQRLEARILMVADHSLHETFMKLYGQDEYAAYTALSRYMLGVFTQLATIFAHLTFSNAVNSSSASSHQILFRLAGPPTIIVRPEDCPLRGPMLIALQQSSGTANASWTGQKPASSSSSASSSSASSSAALSPVDNNSTTIIPNETLSPNDPDDADLAKALATGIEGWNRMDALRAVQWIHRWVEHSEPLLPQRDHVMVLTRMDLISQRNDSATQGMAYVRAICRGADSVSVVVNVSSSARVENGNPDLGLSATIVTVCPSHISVVEDVGGLSTATVAAHELSHSLGAFHDGADANANCSARQNFLMAPISASHTHSAEFGDTFPNAFVLSECSTRQIEQFLGSSDSNCLWRQSDGDSEHLSDQSSLISSESSAHSANEDANTVLPMKLEQGIKRRTDDNRQQQHHSPNSDQTVGGDGEWWSTVVSRGHGKPGEQFDAGKQCQIVFGTHYGNCRRKDFMLLNADPCRRLWCKNRRQRRWAPCETKGFLPMMDGTRCADGKWCIRGVCTAKDKPIIRKRSQLPSQSDDLVGDGTADDCRDLNRSFCASFTAEQLRTFCRVLNFSRICCANCQLIFRQRNKWKMKSSGKTDPIN